MCSDSESGGIDKRVEWKYLQDRLAATHFSSRPGDVVAAEVACDGWEVTLREPF